MVFSQNRTIMFDAFKDKLNLSPDKWQEFQSYYHRLEVPARTVLLHEGEISKRAFIIEKGCLRVWFNNDGADTTFQFFFENGNVSSVESFRKQVPSLFTIESVEACVLHYVFKEDLDKIFGELLEVEETRNQFLEVLFERQLHYMKHCLSFIKDSPADRYLALVNENPHIVQRVPQHYIASYLGITPVSLSRIRNRILKQK
jgi:CRP-like cAMP-binding protein